MRCCQRPLHDLVQVLVGGDVQYSKQLTNSVVTDKIAQFQPRWKCLAPPKPATEKMHAVKSMAWPNNMLHGIVSAFCRGHPL